jgi:hypothetical protein
LNTLYKENSWDGTLESLSGDSEETEEGDYWVAFLSNWNCNAKDNRGQNQVGGLIASFPVLAPFF